MKKVHIICGVLLFLLISVSSASAIQIPVNIYKNEPDDPVPPNTAITAVCSGNTITVQAAPTSPATSLPTNFDITSIYLPIPYVTGANAQNTGTAETWVHTGDSMPTLGGYFGAFPTKSGVCEWGGLDNIKSGGPIVITYPDNIESTITSISGCSIVVKISWNGDESNWVGGKTEIPEFPTMALPVAAILGLLFITQRRKEN